MTLGRQPARPAEHPPHDARAWMRDLSGRVLPALVASLAEAQDDRPAPGDQIGAYRLLSVLGEGGMGVVFRAHDERLDRVVAIKFLHRQTGDREETPRLLSEARAAARLDHPGIAVVHEVSGVESDRPFIVMACHDGQTLARRLDERPMAVDDAVAIARHLADALATAHRAGVVHGDVKPSNILLAPGGGIRLVDFGLARLAVDEGHGPGAGAGTLPYMSPEQLEGQPLGAQSDIWSVGVTLYEMLSGARPFDGPTADDVREAIRTGRPKPLRERRPEVSDALWSVVSRCLEKIPANRFASAEDVLAALTAVLPDWPEAEGAASAAAEATAAADEKCREGRLLLDVGDPPSTARARDAFLAALSARPDHARAWCGLSDAYELMAYLAMLAPDEAHLRARAAAERALEIEPDLAEAHVSLATVLVDYHRDWTTAGELYRRALELAPEYAAGHQFYAEYLRDLGRFDEAITEIDEAIRLNPLSPFFRVVRGIVLHMARRHDEALEAFENLLQAAPDNRMAYFYLAMPLAATGQFDRALEALDRADPDQTLPDAVSARGGLLARMGRHAEAEAAVSTLRRLGTGSHVLPFHEAIVHLGLRDYDTAIALLEDDADRRTWFSRILGVAPELDEVRQHPRFQALLARVRRATARAGDPSSARPLDDRGSSGPSSCG